jgi:hypothetical protein
MYVDRGLSLRVYKIFYSRFCEEVCGSPTSTLAGDLQASRGILLVTQPVLYELNAFLGGNLSEGYEERSK